MSYRLRKAGLRQRVRLTYVSAEPFLGHFGIGGLPHGQRLLSMFLKKEHITAVLDAHMTAFKSAAWSWPTGRASTSPTR